MYKQHVIYLLHYTKNNTKKETKKIFIQKSFANEKILQNKTAKIKYSKKFMHYLLFHTNKYFEIT